MSLKNNGFDYPVYYKESFGENSKASPALQRFLEGISIEGPIADFGAGFGRILNNDLNRKVFLVERDESMLRLLAEKVISSSTDSQIIACDAMRTPIESESMAAVVFMENTIAEMNPFMFALCEASRVLKKDGKILIINQNPEFGGIFKPTYRSIKVNGLQLTNHVDTYPDSSFGPFAFRSVSTFQNAERENSFTVSQQFPSFKCWQKIAIWLGFSIEIFSAYSDDLKIRIINEENYLSAAMYSIELKKIRSTQPITPVAELYDRMAPDYGRTMDKAFYAVPDWIEKNSQKWRTRHPRFLDLACGNGWMAKFLRTCGVDPCAFGVDISEKMIEEARAGKNYFALLNHDLDNGLPIFEYQSFDVISCIGLTEFVKNTSFLLGEIKNRLRVAGELWISFDISKNPRAAITKNIYAKEEALDLVRQAGLSIKQQDVIDAYVSPSNGETVQYLVVVAERESFL